MINYSTIKEKQCAFCDRKSPLFSVLSKNELTFINSNKIEVRFKTGEIIRKQGAFLSHVISINMGMAKMYLEGLNNHDVILKIIKATNFIGGPGMYVDHRHHYTVKALTDTSACFLEVNAFKELLHSNNEFADKFFEDFSRNTLTTYDRLMNLTQKQIPGRMADGLIYLSEEIFESPEFELVLSKKDLGELSGMSSDSATKILRSFREDGIIEIKARHIIIKNMDELIRISRNG
ncbi:MAG: Crp/Fnr family transcriptional regulator [Bacteroidota bacterium]|nr:Crp/Fnr family transcriptional regulator [Bacteroidota bacterium]